MHSRSERTVWRTAAAVTSWCVVAWLPVGVSGAEAAAPRPAGAARSKTIVDHSVVPAGGGPCRHCGTGACRVHGGHLAGCRDGMCAPHCPVRPSQYGYYHTQWRRWPGQGVVPTSAEEAATPVAPPASQVPTIDEESPPAPTREPAEGGMPAGDEPRTAPELGDQPAQGGALPTDPIPEQPARAEPAAELPSAEPPVPPAPPGDAPAVPGKDAADGGLFDQSAAPVPDADVPVESGAMRYPAPVGRSLAAGIPPWRLRPQGDQRAAASVRGR